MNYNIKLCGRRSTEGTFDKIAKLIIESASMSHYVVTVYPRMALAPYSTLMLEFDIVGSSKKDIVTATIDCDNGYIGSPVDIYLNPDVLDIERTDDLSHYWGMAGTLFKIIPDLSPAYFTSYLLDNKQNKELALFKQYSLISLPPQMQELLTGKR
ncbi:MAG: hypothetical protein LBV09_07520 [Deferribacteraceae bacterium]|jgi:hypothetical protein|nr:hypothetical protein [Deferribacteraceae bacterium]